ncbi:chorismate-binding protein [Streptococcus pasteurianus]|uniref:chorismate-binding protein n=1 Tax=Streptococcus pasteurianus TaxID=197614 RepID=UPI003013AAB0
MKATIARGINDAQDFRNKHWLANDSKNRSENMMIVNLLRNDTGRILGWFYWNVFASR